MAEYRVDPDGLRAAAFAFGGLAHSGPPGILPGAGGCGHPPTVAALEADALAYSGAWRRSEQAVLDVGTAALVAADEFAASDAAAASAAGRGTAGTGAVGSGARRAGP